MEELFNESNSLPLTKKVLIDEEKLLDLIDQMRLAIPEEIKNAQSIINQKDRITAQSKEEANRTLLLAKEQSEILVSKDAVVQEAKIIAEEIIKKAKDETELIKKEADQYAIDSLDHLEIELSKILAQVRNGIATLKDNQVGNTTQPEKSFESSSSDPLMQP
ncbi:MAG: hypothetical protein Q7J07_04220 [Pelolinea sp.]|nr:hypothetical protein [Pelolinea sp.]